MVEDRETTKIVDTTERGKDAHKNNNITATPMRAEVTLHGKQSRERQQEPPKNCRGMLRRGSKIILA